MKNESSEKSNAPQFTIIQIDLIYPHPHNPRGTIDPTSLSDLADSIKEKGILEPLLVVPVRDKGKSWDIKSYILVAGHRRLAAAIIAGLSTIPVILRDLSAIEQEEIMLVENLQREDLSLLQEARAFQRLIDQGVTQQDVARKIGVSSARISQRLQILKLPASVQSLYSTGELPITLAPVLMKISSIDRQKQLAQMVASRKIAVGKVEQIAAREQKVRAGKKESPPTASGRPKKTEAQISPTPTIFTRADALAALSGLNGAKTTFKDVRLAFDAACTFCGMAEHPEVCAACFVPHVIKILVQE